MKEITYADNLYGSTWGFREYCTKEEFETLRKEVLEFCKANRSLPVSEQKKLFDEKYGHIVKPVRDFRLLKEIRSINGKLSFFVILGILSLIGAIIISLSQGL